MYIVFGILSFIVICVIIRLCVLFKDKIHFYSIGMDSSFSFKEIHLLWKLASLCHLEDACSLYISVPALTKAMSKLVEHSTAEHILNTEPIQNLLTKLYAYRTKIELMSDEHKAIVSTRSLSAGQKLRIIRTGAGMFSSEVVNSGREFIISLPLKENQVLFSGDDWVGENISIYLWRKGDAGYVFDAYVKAAGVFLSRPCLIMEHVDNLERTQKRQSVRCLCSRYVNLYIMTPSEFEEIDYNAVETARGYRALLEDISESGALIRIGGRGRIGMHIKLQFELNGSTVLMYGIVRNVEYNEDENISRLHFECIHIDEAMRNVILGYVYNVTPKDDDPQVEKLRALSATIKDAAAAGEKIDSGDEAVPVDEEEYEYLKNNPLSTDF